MRIARTNLKSLLLIGISFFLISFGPALIFGQEGIAAYAMFAAALFALSTFFLLPAGILYFITAFFVKEKGSFGGVYVGIILTSLFSILSACMYFGQASSALWDGISVWIVLVSLAGRVSWIQFEVIAMNSYAIIMSLLALFLYVALMFIPTSILIGFIKLFEKKYEGNFYFAWLILATSCPFYAFLGLKFFANSIDSGVDFFAYLTWFVLAVCSTTTFAYYFKGIRNYFYVEKPTLRSSHTYIYPERTEDPCLSYFDLS